MRLVHTNYALELDLQENQITVLSIEHPKAYTDMLRDIWNQTQGGEGAFILSEQEKIKNISKEAECIFNPFSLDCNNRKVIGKLYQELREQADSVLIEKSAALNSSIVDYIDALLLQVPYALEYKADLDITGLLRLYDVKVGSSGESLLDSIVDYLRIMKQVCGIVVYVFVGLKQYLAEDELRKLYEFAFYEKIQLIIMESSHSRYIDGEKCWIFDKDMCIIEV